MKVYFLSPVNHDGKVYGVDDACDMANEHAKPLIEAGVATTNKPKKVEAESTGNEA